MKRHKLFAALFALTIGASAQTMIPQPTNDSFVLSGLWDADFENEIIAVPADGTGCYLTVGLAGGKDDPNRLYTAYNLDMKLPFGLEVMKDGDDYDIAISTYPDGIYPYTSRKGQYTYMHSGGFAIKGTAIRVACTAGTTNAELTDTEGDLFELAIRANTPYVKPGKNKVAFSGLNLTVVENAQKYVPADFEADLDIAEGEVSVSLAVQAGKYSTAILPFDAAVPAGVDAYEISGIDGNCATLSAITELKAYTPYILYSEDGYAGRLSGVITAANYEACVNEAGVAGAGFLKGAIKPQSVSTGYVLQTLDSEGQKFYTADGQTFSIPSGKCWLETTSEIRAFSFAIDNEETGLVNVNVNDNDNGEAYNLAGQRISRSQKGVRVQNGKKVLY